MFKNEIYDLCDELNIDPDSLMERKLEDFRNHIKQE